MLRNSEPPLKNRILRSPGSLSVPLVPLQPRPDKYKHWTDGQIAKAVDAVRCQGLTVRRAAESYNVPKSTLHDRLSGRVLAGGCSGPPKYLTDEEEEQLEDFLIGSASVGYARSRQQVMQLVGEVVSHKGLASNVTHGWWEGFRKRHPKLTLRTAAPMSYARAMASDPEIINNYFDLLEHTLVENDLLDKPAQIFNMDETGMPLDPSPPRVVARRGQKHPSAVGSGDKSQITVLSCCSAAGYAIPPLVIFDRKSLKTELTTGEVPGTVYGLSKKGWIDGDLFDLWFHKHFLAYAPPVRPLLFLMDGHSSHFQPSVIQRAAEERVIVFCLPPHTTHLTQPLDKGCFGPLKVHWREECWSYICAHPDRVITRYQFSELFGKAWMKAMTMQNIVGGFRTTGVYPFNRSVLIPVKESRCISLAERTGLRFIPLYSPSCRKRAQVPVLSFSTEEIAKFQKRFEEGYDLPDERYDKWIEMYHPKSLLTESHESDGSRLQFGGSLSQPSTPEGAENSESNVSDSPSHQSDGSLPLPSTPEEAKDACVTLPHTSVLSKLLAQQVPAIKYPDTKPKYSARVLTSLENRLQLEEKERRKKEEAEEKERKKKEREQKRLAVAEEKQRKALERERQRLAREERRKSTTSKKTTQASSSQKGAGRKTAVGGGKESTPTAESEPVVDCGSSEPPTPPPSVTTRATSRSRGVSALKEVSEPGPLLQGKHALRVPSGRAGRKTAVGGVKCSTSTAESEPVVDCGSSEPPTPPPSVTTRATSRSRGVSALKEASEQGPLLLGKRALRVPSGGAGRKTAVGGGKVSIPTAESEPESTC